MRKYQVRFRGGITEKEHCYLVGILPDTNDGRKLALDQRLIDPDLPDDPDSKVNICVGKVFEIWEQTKAQRSAQLVFCDLSTPKAGVFNVYDDMKAILPAFPIWQTELSRISRKLKPSKRGWNSSLPAPRKKSSGHFHRPQSLLKKAIVWQYWMDF